MEKMSQGEHFPVKEKLHTDILEQKYGPIRAVVLRHDNVHELKKGSERIREALLVDESGILRTYALTFLTYDKSNSEISLIDDEIRNGGLIGQTFRNHGYTVKKNVIDVFIIDVPQWMQDDFRSDQEKAKARVTEFYAKKENSTPVIYGNVLEVYSPDFKDPQEGINQIDRAQINPLTSTLQSTGVPIDEIWDRLDKAAEDNEWEDFQESYKQAEIFSQPAVSLLHDKISKYLNNKSNI